MGATKGVGLLSNQRALEALDRLLEQGAVQAGVMPMDWASWQRYYGSLAGTPYFSLLISGNDFGTSSKSAYRETREHILASQPENRTEMLESYLAKQMARILKVPLASVDSETPIVNMGIDSLMAIELKNQIETDLAVSVPMGRLIQGPTLLELADWVMQLLVAPEPVDATAAVDSLLTEYEEGVF